MMQIKIDKTLLFPILVVVLTLLTHGWNVFGAPVFEGDEGIYTAQGWWLVNFGKIAPYTYWYDHAPFGWLMIGLWQKLTGGPFTFGFSLYSTRLFMVIVAAVTNLFLYLTAKRLTRSKLLGLVASFFFAASPLAVFFHRRVLLDNLATLWLILSLFFLWKSKGDLLKIWLSGICFGLAFLAKEIAIVFLPVFVYAVFAQTQKGNGRFSRMLWLATVFFSMGLFPLIAILKREFLPVSWLGGSEHVSFVETVLFQLTRGKSTLIWSPYSQFRQSLASWFATDSLFLSLGIGATIFLLFWGTIKKNAYYKTIAFSVVFFWLFLARGGLVMDFYIVPVLPLMALAIAQTVGVLIKSIPEMQRDSYFRWGVILTLTVLFAYYVAAGGRRLYHEQPTASQITAIDYTRETVPSDAVVVVDAWAYLDMRLPPEPEARSFVNAEWFSKVVLDPAIRDKKLANNWRNIGYILVTHEMFQIMRDEDTPSLLRQAYDNSRVIRDFPPLYPETRDMEQMKSSTADWATLVKVEK